MVKNGCLPYLSGIWITKKPLKFSDLLIVDSKWLQLFTTNHLPMQNFEKMEWRISSDAMVVPVISDKWWMHSRKS